MCVVLPRAVRAAISDWSVVMACCWTVMVSLACWNSGLRLRGTVGADDLGVERVDWRGSGMTIWFKSVTHCAM